MDNHEISLSITASDIYNRLSEKDKKRFAEIKIANATLINDNAVIIDCLALGSTVKKCEVTYRFIGDGYINID